jgi:hypothetical protein
MVQALAWFTRWFNGFLVIYYLFVGSMAEYLGGKYRKLRSITKGPRG